MIFPKITPKSLHFGVNSTKNVSVERSGGVSRRFLRTGGQNGCSGAVLREDSVQTHFSWYLWVVKQPKRNSLQNGVIFAENGISRARKFFIKIGEVEVVNLMFDLYLELGSLNSVRKELTNKGILTPPRKLTGTNTGKAQVQVQAQVR